MKSIRNSSPALAVSQVARSNFRNWQRLVPLAVILFIELLLVAVAYQFLRDMTCLDFTNPEACYGVRNGLGRVFAVIAIIALYIPARRVAFGFLWDSGPPGPLVPPRALALIGLGFAVILLPLLVPSRALAGLLLPFALCLGAGLALSLAGVLSGVGGWSDWGRAVRAGGAELAALLGLALVAPEVTAVLNGAWGLPVLTDATFAAVASLLGLFPGELSVDRSQFILGLDDFIVEVAEPCSGLQGFALIVLMLTVYLTLYRRYLRMPQALLLLPIGLAASFALNVVRIATLIWLGARVSPDLADNGFHSHAGWLLFTLLSFGLIGLSRAVPQFRRRLGEGPASGIRAPLPLRRDPVVALLVPLMAFLLSGLVASTFVTVPDLAYPLRAVVMLGALLFFLPVWRRLDWRPGLLPLAAGFAVGAVWALGDVPAGSDPALGAALAGLPPLALALWIGARVAGTVLLVPLIEEAAFRAYLIGQLPPADSGRWVAVAVVGSALLFALLHSNAALGLGAGLVFALVYLRRRRLADAFWAHAAANLVVAGVAMATGDWGAI